MSDSDPLSSMTPEQQRALLQELLQEKAKAAKCFPMASGQQGLWYAFRRDPAETTFNVFFPSRVRNVLDIDALRRSIEFLVERHSCLRTTFSDADQQLRQTVHDELKPEFTVVDAGGMSEEAIRRRVIEETQRPFDLEHGPLLRLIVLQAAADDFVVLASTHHIVVDFWSLILILTELRTAYPCFAENRIPNFPPANSNYAAFVAWQSKLLDGVEGDELRAHWQETLDGAATVLEWGTDFRRPPNFTGRADVTPLNFAPGTAERISDIAASAKTTTTAVVMAALQVFVARSANQKSFLVGSPFSGRGHQKFEGTVGFFVNMLPLRAELSDNPSFLSLVRRVGKTILTALEHERLPFAEIVRSVQPPRDPTRSPMFQVSATFEKAHVRAEHGRAGFLFPSEQSFSDFGGLRQESYYIPHPTCHYDVEFIFEQTDADLRGMICYCRDLFSPETAEAFAQNFQGMLASLLNSPNMSIDAADWGMPLSPRKRIAASSTAATMVHLLGPNGSSIALRDQNQAYTYQQFQELTGRLARQLRSRGIGAGDLVPVVSVQGPIAAILIYSVVRSGAAVVPIDVNQPAISVHDLIEDTSAKLILASSKNQWAKSSSVPLVTYEQLLTENNGCEPPIEPKPTDLAYVIYTSGSSGKPKGVMIQHSAIANTLQWRSKVVTLSDKDRVLMVLSHQFDAGFGIVFSSLSQGAQVVWGDTGVSRDIDALIHQIIRDQITILPTVPSLLRLIVTHPRFKECRCLQQIWSGGESMPADLPALIWEHSSARIWNFYGPTEAAIEATAHEIKDQDPRRPIPIGLPVQNTEVLVLDDSLREVPNTVPGQLAIRGRGLSLGYLNRPELTKEKFVVLPGATDLDSRVYLTGDLCRRRVDGTIDFLGRMDDQVKVSGYRIELEEIESVVRLHSAVSNVAVTVMKRDTAAAHLVAFVTVSESVEDKAAITTSIKRHAAERLPAYKRPTAVQVIDRLPIGSSGKVNRRLLPDHIDRNDESSDYVAPSTPLENHLATLWGSMLEIEHVGVNQNFFQLGGSSLQAAMMTAKLSEDLEVHVPTALLFDLADIAKLSQRLVQLHESEMAARFGMESVTAYSRSALPSIQSATGEESTTTAANHPLLARLKETGDRTPYFMVHPPGGIVVCYRELADQLHVEQPLLAIRSRGLHGRETLPSSVAEMAADYIDAMRIAQPRGPYVLGGWSLGGIIAYEMTQQLLSSGEEVERLILLDSTIPEGATDLVDQSEQANGLEYGLELTLEELSELKADDQLPFLWQHAINLGVLSDETPRSVVDQVVNDLQSLFHHHVKLTSDYRIEPIDASILLIRPQDVPFEVKTSEDRGWRKLARNVQVEYVPGHHHSMVQMPHVSVLADRLQNCDSPTT